MKSEMRTMKNKGYYISKFISLLFVVFFLFYVFMNNSDLLSRILIVFFLICNLVECIKTILFMMGKTLLAKKINKIYVLTFLLYWFSFLSYWCYYNFIEENNMLIVLSLPFWLVGIYLLYKSFFKRNQQSVQFKTTYSFPVIISGMLVGICLLAGLIMFFIGIKDTNKLNDISKNYITTNGYFSDYEIYGQDRDGITYRLIYIYNVDGIDYTVKTDYGTNYIPDINSEREVKYNPEDPKEAVLLGTNSQSGLIYMGAFFILGSLAFILGALTILGYFDKLKIDVMGTYFGFAFLLIGIGIIMFQNGTTGSLIETMRSFGLWIIIPFLFIGVGLFQIFKCLFFDQYKIKRKS